MSDKIMIRTLAAALIVWVILGCTAIKEVADLKAHSNVRVVDRVVYVRLDK